MFKKYFPTLFQKTNRKKTSPQKGTAFYSFLEKPSPKKYNKRNKYILPKISNKVLPSQLLSIKHGLIVLGILSVIVGGFILTFTTYASITNINIYREGSLIDINRAYSQLDYLRGKNILNIDSKSIAQRLQKSQSSISNIRINKDFPNSINIYLGSYEIMFQTENYFILTNGSIVLKENVGLSQAPYIFVSEDIGEYVDFQKTLNPKEIETILNVLAEASKNILGFESRETYYFTKERELIMRDSESTLYIFDLQQDIDVQIRRVAIYKQESGDTTQKAQVYIDVRIPEKLFLCGYEVESTCNNNLESIYGDTIFQDFLPVVTSELPL